MTHINPDALFHPRSVAVIGSTSAGKIGAALLEQIQAGGFPGELYAVNPKASGWGRASGFASLEAIGAPVDLAVIASPAATVAGVLEDCGRAHVPVALVITAGFGEAGNRQGEAELVRVAQEGGVCLVGPNTAGVVCTGSRLFATLEVQPPAGRVALVSQSGALGGVVLAAAKERGLGISKFISYGNGAGLAQVDFLDYLAEDPETAVVALYIESVPDGRAFMDALSACARAKPVVVIKAGRTGAGQRATASHTGSLAGSDAVYEAAIAQCGAVRVGSVDELVDLCSALAHLPPLKGPRLAIVTNSGGPGVLAADLAETLGLAVAEPSLQAQAALRGFLPAHASPHNPVDLTVEGTREGYARALQALLPDADAALAINVATPYLDSLALVEGILDGAAGSGKPAAACFLPGEIVGESVRRLEADGVPNFPSPERAVAALAGLRRLGEARRRLDRFPVTPWAAVPCPEAALLPGEGALLEPQAMDWLEANGLPAPQRRFVASAEQAARACAAVGYPAVMKVVAGGILHKSEHGGVVTGIRSRASAREAFAALRRRAEGLGFRGVMVYPQVSEAQEVLVGLWRDPQFGPVVVCGLGGIYTELWQDAAVRVAPVSEAEAGEMIAATRLSRLLAGARGRPPCDLEALKRLVARVSWLPFRFPDLAELDLNPVFALPEGALIGDVRVIREYDIDQQAIRELHEFSE